MVMPGHYGDKKKPMKPTTKGKPSGKQIKKKKVC
jgi:hypothetical protein